jgi:hypothetical protein
MHDVLFVNRELLKGSELEWSETMIRARSEEMAKLITRIWPTPEGYTSGFATETVRPRQRVDLNDLIAAELLSVGAILKPRPKKHRDQEAVVLSDGRIEWNGQFFSSPSLAGRAISGQTAVNGWYFFSIDAEKKKKVLNALRIEYLDAIAADPEDDDSEM